MNNLKTTVILSEVKRRWEGLNSSRWKLLAFKLDQIKRTTPLVAVRIEEEGEPKFFVLKFETSESSRELEKIESFQVDNVCYNPLRHLRGNIGLEYDSVNIRFYKPDCDLTAHHDEVGELELNGVRFVWEEERLKTS